MGHILSAGGKYSIEATLTLCLEADVDVEGDIE